MSLKIELSLEMAAPTKVLALFDPVEERFIIVDIHHIDVRFLLQLQKHAKKKGIEPSREILEANAKTRNGTSELPWSLLKNFSRQSLATQGIIRRAFAPMFRQITIEADGYDVSGQEIVSNRRVRFCLAPENTGGYIWIDLIRQISMVPNAKNKLPRT